jgi:hypothetical protein
MNWFHFCSLWTLTGRCNSVNVYCFCVLNDTDSSVALHRLVSLKPPDPPINSKTGYSNTFSF